LREPDLVYPLCGELVKRKNPYLISVQFPIINPFLVLQMGDSEFAKTHLREHLSSLLIPPISEGFWSILDSAVELCQRNNQIDKILQTFQNMLTRIPEWSDTTLSTEVDRIVKITKCTYLDDLLMGVFLAYMKSFASLHYRGSSKEIKIDFDRPNLAKFIHELYKHSARKIWQVAYLFKKAGVPSEQQARNRQEIEKLISDCMEQVIRSFLPWEAIAKQYFMQEHVEEPIHESTPVVEDKKEVSFGEDDSESEDEEEEQPVLHVTDETAELEFEQEQPKEEFGLEAKDTDETLVLNL